MRLLVCGGRNFRNHRVLHDTLMKFHDDYAISILIHGGAGGADTMAGDWAKMHGIHTAQVDALWNHYDNSAGFRRNSALLALQPSHCIAFAGGPGTASMVQMCKTNHIPTDVITCN